MSCVKCKSSPCACNDHGLTTPCDYTGDCPPDSELCQEIIAEECVRAYYADAQDIRIDDLSDIYDAITNPGGQLSSPGKLLNILNNENLAMTLQKILLYLYDNDCAKADDLNGHAPYYIYLTNVTGTSVTVNWTGWSPVTTNFNVMVSTDDGITYLADNPTPLVPSGSTMSYTVNALTTTTNYVFKITARMVGTPSPQNCDSCKAHTKTLV